MSDWIAQHFLHPSYVWPWGVALVSVPVIVHLINRLRYRRVRFAAMEFLLKSQQRNRRRLLIEQLLLLLLRIAIVTAILVLLGRLVLDPSALWAFRGAKSHHVVLLDDSGSMQDRWGETSAFHEGLSIVRKLVGEGVRRPGTQRLTILLLSKPEQPLCLKRDVDNGLAAELETIFERLSCTHQSFDLSVGVDAAAKLLAQDAGGLRHFHVISDFRGIDWQERPALRTAFAAVAKTKASVDLARTVGESHENVALTGLGGDVQTAAAGVPVRLTATVRNFGSKVAEHVRLAVFADGTALPLSFEIDRIEGGKERQRDIDVTFKKAGKHSVEIRLPEDALPADNHRYAAVEINVANPVLIIDGSPDEDDGSYVSTALAADSSITGFATRIERPDFLRREPLDRFRCIYLLNVPQLPKDAIEALADYVRRGGGLAWFLGNAVNPAFYNDFLFGQAKGLFPVRLGRGPKAMTHPDATSHAPDLSFSNHPIFRVFQGQNNPFVEDVRINAWIPVADDWVRDDNKRRDGVETLATLAAKEPIAFERQYGKGRVFAMLTTAGPKWNDWGSNPSVVVVQLELAKHLSREDQSLERRTVGEPIEVAFNSAEYLETVEVTAPDATGQHVTRLKATRPTSSQGDGPGGGNPATASPVTAAKSRGKPRRPDRAVGTSSKATDDAIRALATYSETDRPGIYVVRLFKDQMAAPQERWIAYNVPADEGNLKLATNAEVLARLPSDVHAQIHDPGAFHWVEGNGAGAEARTLLLGLLAVFLLCEQILANRLSYHPTAAKGAA